MPCDAIEPVIPLGTAQFRASPPWEGLLVSGGGPVDLTAHAHLGPAGSTDHSHPEEAVFEAMLEGWEAEQRRARLSPATIKARRRAVRRFVEFCNQYPWRWTCADLEEWTVSLMAEPHPVAFSSVRPQQQAVAKFCDYLAGDAYGWAGVCEERFGTPLAQVCHQWTNIAHSCDYEARPENRPLSRDELQAFFDHADEQVVEGERRRSKPWLRASRDAALFKVIYAWGLRPQEAAHLDVADLGPNPATPELGRFGMLSVPSGPASNGGPPPRREVCTVLPWAADVVADYLVDVRPRYGCEADPAMWLTERGTRISASHVNERFRAYRDAVGLPRELGPHCLRQSYMTHLIEDGFDELFVQQQVGLAWGSTAALYTGVSTYFKNRARRAALTWGPASGDYAE